MYWHNPKIYIASFDTNNYLKNKLQPIFDDEEGPKRGCSVSM